MLLVVESDVPKGKAGEVKARKNFTLSPDAYEALKRMAYWRRKSMSQILDELVRADALKSDPRELRPVPSKDEPAVIVLGPGTGKAEALSKLAESSGKPDDEP